MKYFLFVLVLLVGLIGAEEAILVSTEIEAGNWVLLKMNPDGTGEETFFSFDGLPSSETGNIKYIEISPDGQWIALDSDHDHSHAPSNRNIFLIDSDVTGWMMITPDNLDEGYWYSGPTGTITGTILWGSSPPPMACVFCQGVVGEYSVDGVTGAYSIPNVPPGTRMVLGYGWDGVEIIWGWAMTEVVAGATSEAYVEVGYSDPYGKDQYSNPKWSPDGNSLYYQTFLVENVERCGIPGDWVSDSILTGDWERNFDGYDVHKTDGRIVYAIDDDGIYTANSEGSGRTQVFAHGSESMQISFGTNPMWQPGGSKIAFRGYYEGDWTYWMCVIDASSDSIEAYFNFPDYFVHPYCWSPDGNYVVVGVYSGDLPDSIYLYAVNPYDPVDDNIYLGGPANIIDVDWGNLISGIHEDEILENVFPVSVSVSPNPVGKSARICYLLPQKSAVQVEIFDLMGRQVKNWDFHELNAGEHFIVWDGKYNNGSRVLPGVYFCKIKTDFGSSSIRIVQTK